MSHWDQRRAYQVNAELPRTELSHSDLVYELRELVKQQRVIAASMIRKEMRECGVWGPMPRVDGNPLSADLLERFPKKEYVEGLFYTSDELQPFLDAYSLKDDEDMLMDDRANLLFKFLTGRGLPTKESWGITSAATCSTLAFAASLCCMVSAIFLGGT